MRKDPPLLKIGQGGEIHLPPEAMELLELEPGHQVKLFLDKRRKQIRLERMVEDPWGEAMDRKSEKGFEDILGEQKDRDQEAADYFDKKIKEPPPKRRPEDNPDLWR
jgi:hypothetical protein